MALMERHGSLRCEGSTICTSWWPCEEQRWPNIISARRRSFLRDGVDTHRTIEAPLRCIAGGPSSEGSPEALTAGVGERPRCQLRDQSSRFVSSDFQLEGTPSAGLRLEARRSGAHGLRRRSMSERTSWKSAPIGRARALPREGCASTCCKTSCGNDRSSKLGGRGSDGGPRHGLIACLTQTVSRTAATHQFDSSGADTPTTTVPNTQP